MLTILNAAEAKQRAEDEAPRLKGMVLVLGDTCDPNHEHLVWQHAVKVGASHVLFLPDAEPWLLDRVRELAGVSPVKT